MNTNGSDSAITLNADLVTLEGFTVVNANKSWPNSGIRVNSNNNILKNNNVSNNYYGINISYSPGSTGGNTLNSNGVPADSGDLVLMKRTLIIPADKYVFIERWTNITDGTYLDFPTYIFDKENGTLKPFIVPPGRWFPLERLI